jgi:hypothetical protein
MTVLLVVMFLYGTGGVVRSFPDLGASCVTPQAVRYQPLKSPAPSRVVAACRLASWVSASSQGVSHMGRLWVVVSPVLGVLCSIWEASETVAAHPVAALCCWADKQ